MSKEHRNDINIDAILSGVASLGISKNSPISSEVLAFSAWKAKPVEGLMTLKESKIDNLRQMVGQYLAVDVAVKDLPLLKDPVKSSYVITPYKSVVDPEPKPNLLLAVSTIFYQNAKANKAITPERLCDTLNKYEAIVPRKVLQLIITNKFEDVDFVMYRSTDVGPVFVDRKHSYPTNPGSIGMQFEKAVIQESKLDYHRFYGVFNVKIGDLNICSTGEVDGVDLKGNIIEVKTKPVWVRDTSRNFDIWAQSVIANVKRIMFAKFTAERGVYNGPVTFSSKNIAMQSPDDFMTDDVDVRVKNGLKFVQEMLKACQSPGKVYSVTGSGRIPSVREVPNHQFPLSTELIMNLAKLHCEES
ncbi:hypothetical protein MIR68_008141 [Amoeboaphelidium protococcarum]|nr:hypothetical protein MIR68_008141 [Amoeboaphelidium protococcarum]